MLCYNHRIKVGHILETFENFCVLYFQKIFDNDIFFRDIRHVTLKKDIWQMTSKIIIMQNRRLVRLEANQICLSLIRRYDKNVPAINQKLIICSEARNSFFEQSNVITVLNIYLWHFVNYKLIFPNIVANHSKIFLSLIHVKPKLVNL